MLTNGRLSKYTQRKVSPFNVYTDSAVGLAGFGLLELFDILVNLNHALLVELFAVAEEEHHLAIKKSKFLLRMNMKLNVN